MPQPVKLRHADARAAMEALAQRMPDRGELPKGQRVAEMIAGALSDLEYRARVRGVPVAGPTWEGLIALEHYPATKFVADSLEARKSFVILGGDVGIGKSVAVALAVLRAPGRPGAAPLYAHAVPLAESVARPYDDARRALCDRAERAPVLAVDDLGLEVRDERGVVLDALRGLFARRFDSGLTTLVTTNLEWDEDPNDPGKLCLSRDYLDRRLLDRFAASGAMRHVRGRSLRRAPKVERAPSRGNGRAP